MDVPSILVEISLSCDKLIDKDTFSKSGTYLSYLSICPSIYLSNFISIYSDPFCVVYMNNTAQGRYVEIARTETIWDSLNPVWQKKLVIPYR